MFASIILLISIFLPFNSCTRLLDESNFKNVAPQDRPPKVTMVTKDATGETVEKEYYKVKTTTYVLSRNGWTYSFALIWPILIFLLAKVHQRIKKLTWSIVRIPLISASHSEGFRPPIPIEAGHSFRRIPAMHSGRSWPRIPIERGHLFRSHAATFSERSDAEL